MASIYRRGKKWWAKVQRAGVLQRRSLETESKTVAERRLRAWLDELDAIAWGEKPRRTFRQAAERFAAEHLPRIKPSSATRYLISLGWLSDLFADRYLDQITSAALSEFETARRAKGASPPTIRRDLACLSSLFGLCAEWEWIEGNPVTAFLRARAKRGLKEAAPHTRYLSKEEEEKLLSKAPEPLRAAIIFAIETGLRREEQFGLTWDRVDLVAREIRLTGNTKSGRARRVPITERAGTVLGTLQRIPKSPFVFRHPDGSRFVQLAKGLAAARKRAAIRRLCWHDLRRTCGCRLLQERGMPIEAVALWLGHSSIAVTERVYAFLEFENLRDRAQEWTHRATDNGKKPA